MELVLLEDKGLDEEALDMIAAEDIRQIEIYGYTKHSINTWHLILDVECGELANAILACDTKQVETEATHIATVAIKIARMVRRLREE